MNHPQHPRALKRMARLEVPWLLKFVFYGLGSFCLCVGVLCLLMGALALLSSQKPEAAWNTLRIGAAGISSGLSLLYLGALLDLGLVIVRHLEYLVSKHERPPLR